MSDGVLPTKLPSNSMSAPSGSDATDNFAVVGVAASVGEGPRGVAYNTIRKSMELLRERGLIVTMHGRGTFVVPEDQRPRHP